MQWRASRGQYGDHPHRARGSTILKNISLDDPARSARGHHGLERLGEIDARVRSPFCRRAAAVSGFDVGVRAAICGAAREAGGGLDHRAAAERGDRAAHHARRRKIDRRHRDRGLSFPAPALREARHAVLPEVRGRRGKADARGGGEKGGGRRAAGAHPRARAAGEGAQRFPHRSRALGGAAGLSRSCSWMANGCAWSASRSWSASASTPSRCWSASAADRKAPCSRAWKCS